jgi:predicted ATP-grasp superfamily ATP-dependent carboligase
MARKGSFNSYDRFAAGLAKDIPAAFILGADRGHGLAMTRSLGRRGIPVVTLGTPGTPGMKSRFGFPVSIAGLSDGELIPLLLRLGDKLPVRGVLLPTGDLHVVLLSRHEEALSRYFRFALAARDTLEVLADKRQQYAFAARCGIPIPRTLAPEGIEDLGRVADEIGFPCVIKPAFSQLWAQHQASHGFRGLPKIAIVASQEGLLREYVRMTAGKLNVVIQEWIEGEASALYAVYAYCPIEGEPSMVFVRRELRDWPVDCGSGCYSTGVLDPEAEALGRAFFARARFRGIANIEFKRDARDGQLKLMEFNVRGASQLALAIDSGVDIPFAAYSDLVGAPGADGIPKPMREGVRWIDLGRDVLSAFEHRRRGGAGLGRWVRDVLRARSHAFFAADDLRPAVARAFELLHAFYGGISRPAGNSDSPR